jgi:hypothetical protein
METAIAPPKVERVVQEGAEDRSAVGSVQQLPTVNDRDDKQISYHTSSRNLKISVHDPCIFDFA